MPCPPWLQLPPSSLFPRGMLMDLLIFGPMFPGVLGNSFAKCATCTWAVLTLGTALGAVVLKVGGMWCP